MKIPEACQGCEPAQAIACQTVVSVSRRVEDVTGVRVWGETSYADGTIELEDCFENIIDPTATDQAVREYNADVRRVNQELYDQTNDCPGLQEGNICGKVALAGATNTGS